jgi:hypothetical protein
MQQKNYYQILQVDANCTNDAIKKAYRKLALQCHPDITQNNPLHTQRFNEIKEAYEVLNNPVARKKFHEKIYFNPLEPNVYNMHDVIVLATKVDGYIKTANKYTIDYTLIELHLYEILESNQLLIQTCTNEVDKNNLWTLLSNCIKVLPYAPLQKLNPIVNNCFSDKASLMNDLLYEKKQLSFLEKYKIYLAILIAILLCLFIALMA